MNVDSHLYYLLVLLLSIVFPFLLSFDKKVNFKQYFPTLLKSVSLVAILFIIGDIYYTHLGVWGFNSNYHLPFKILHLPLEEIGFFFIVPYCCVFIYACLKAYFTIKPKQLPFQVSAILAVVLAIAFLMTFGKLYTSATLFFSVLILAYLSYTKVEFVSYLLFAYLISIIPFMLVNGFLTGCCTPEPIVWYNDLENLGARIISIPIEDFSYGFNLISLNILAFEYFRK